MACSTIAEQSPSDVHLEPKSLLFCTAADVCIAFDLPKMATLTMRSEKLLTRINDEVAKQHTFNGRMKFRVLAGCFHQFAPAEHIGEPVICERGDTTKDIAKP